MRKNPPSRVEKSQPSKAPLTPPILWGLPVVKSAKVVAGDQENVSASTSAIGQALRGSGAPARPACLTKGRQGVVGDADSVRGGDGVMVANGPGVSIGGGGASFAGKRLHTLWTLPGQGQGQGQTRTDAAVGSREVSDANSVMSNLGNAQHCSASAEIAVTGKALSTREGTDGTSGDCHDGRVGASPNGREGISLSGSLLRSALALSTPRTPDGANRSRRYDYSTTRALGKARRGLTSPEGADKFLPSQSGEGGGGRSGCVSTATPSLEFAMSSSGVGTTPPAPRSILVTKKGPTSFRRATASRGVRWLDIVQKEEQQAISRRRRAAKWTGGCRKARDPPTSAPRASSALLLAQEGEVDAAS